MFLCSVFSSFGNNLHVYFVHCLIEGRFAPYHSEVVTWCLGQSVFTAFQLELLLFYDVARNGVSFRNIKLLIYESRLHQPVFLNLPCCDFLWTQKEQEISAPMMSDRYISQLLSKAYFTSTEQAKKKRGGWNLKWWFYLKTHRNLYRYYLYLCFLYLSIKLFQISTVLNNHLYN